VERNERGCCTSPKIIHKNTLIQNLKGQVKNTFFAVKLSGAFMMQIYKIIKSRKERANFTIEQKLDYVNSHHKRTNLSLLRAILI
jgi:hypothetical protein